MKSTRERSSTHYLFKSAGIVAMLSAAGVVSGLILDALILSAFGVGYQTDALFTALTLPLLLSSVLSIQGPKILIPVFSEYLSRGERAAACGLLSNLVTTSFLGLVGISLAGMALSGVIVPLQIPGLESDAIALAVGLSRILFWLVVCQGLSSILQSLLYAEHRFLVSSSGKLISNSVAIVVIVMQSNLGVKVVAAGMLLGWFTQLAVLVWALSAHGFEYRWIFKPTDPKLREIVGSFRYLLGGHIVGEAGTILQNFLGSLLGSGSLTAIRYASRIIQSIAGVLLGSIVRVTLPLVSNHTATNDLRAQRRTLLDSIQLLSAIGVPVCVWLILAAEPLIVLLFERGEFSRAAATLISTIVRIMAADILIGRLVSISQTPFYANLDMQTPLKSSLIFSFAHAVFSFVLVYPLGVLGLAIAVPLASLITTIYMIAKLQNRFGPVGWGEMWGFACRLSASCAVAWVGFEVGRRLTTFTTVPYSLAKVLDLALPTLFGSCSFMIGAILFGLIDSRLLLPGGRRPEWKQK